MYKCKVAIVLALGLAVSVASLSGCSSKKKTTEPVKQERKVTPKPAPPAVKPRAPEKEEERVPRDLSFDTIYFDYHKSNIRSDQRSMLSSNARLMSKYQTVRIQLAGNCDERGTEEYNMALGQRRADSVKEYLTDYGISGSRISTISYGEMRPADSGHNEAAWTLNRRCEIIITGR